MIIKALSQRKLENKKNHVSVYCWINGFSLIKLSSLSATSFPASLPGREGERPWERGWFELRNHNWLTGILEL